MPKLLAVPNIEKFAHLIREQRRIYQHEEEEEVKVFRKSEDSTSREFEKAARRLENARLVLRRFPNIEKLRSHVSKDDPIELRSPVTKEELVAEVGWPGVTNLKDSEVLESIVKKQASDGCLYAAVCASPAVALGSWGLLKGLKATCYPSFIEQLAPTCAATVESGVQQDGKVVTSRGPGTTMEFAIALVEQLYGKEKADEVSRPLVMRANHGDEYTVTEFNPIQWTFDNSPEGGLGGAQAFAKLEKLVNMLKKQKESNRPYGVICASPALVLKPHGLLKGKKATSCHVQQAVRSKTGLWLMATLSPVEGQVLPWSLHWQLWRSFLAAAKHLSLQI